MEYNSRLKQTAAFLLAAVMASTVSAQTVVNPPTAQLKIERVALFKNGLGYFVSTGVLPKKTKTVSLGQLPIPSYGTFWVTYGKDVKVRNLVSAMEALEEQVPIDNVGQLLQLNVGKKVVIRTGSKEDLPVEGVIMKVADGTSPREPSSSYIMSQRYMPDPYGRTVRPGNDGQIQALPLIVIIKTAQGIVSLNANSIVRADFEGQDLATTRSMKYKRPGVRMELEQESDGGKIGVNYLARGITWSPSYLIDITDGKNATFTAQAVIINETVDLQDVAVDLVTGFPNLKFAELRSPVSMSEDLAGFLNSLGNVDNPSQQRGGRYASNNLMGQQAMVNNVTMFLDGFAGVPVPGYSTAAAGTVSEDLFLYPLKAVTLKKGETASVPLFTAEMPYKHIYTWNIGDSMNEEERHQQQERTDGKQAEEVWHSCRLVNNMKMPLTTSSAQFVKDGSIVGQDVCYFTSPNAETTIRINRAMNVLAEQAEFEVERKRDATQFNGSSYDLVQLRGELKLRSRIDKPVNIEITKELSGEVLNSAPGAKDVMTAKGLKKVNATHTLTWSIELKTGEETKLTYSYQVYVRR